MQSITPLTGMPNVQKGSAEAAQAQLRVAQETPAPAISAGPPIVNPALRYDLRLGLVVVEFFDEQGEIANSIPTPRQLKAYESGLNVRSGPMPLTRDLPQGTDQDGLAVVA